MTNSKFILTKMTLTKMTCTILKKFSENSTKNKSHPKVTFKMEQGR